MTDVTEYTVSVIDWQNGRPITLAGLEAFVRAGLRQSGREVDDDGPLYFEPMLPDEKEKWLAELRDPAARQAKGILTAYDDAGQRSDCCWGLYCKALGLTGSRETFSDDSSPTPSEAGQQEFVRYRFTTRYGDTYEGDQSIDDTWAAEHHVDSTARSLLEQANDIGFPFAIIARFIERWL